MLVPTDSWTLCVNQCLCLPPTAMTLPEVLQLSHIHIRFVLWSLVMSMLPTAQNSDKCHRSKEARVHELRSPWPSGVHSNVLPPPSIPEAGCSPHARSAPFATEVPNASVPFSLYSLYPDPAGGPRVLVKLQHFSRNLDEPVSSCGWS